MEMSKEIKTTPFRMTRESREYLLKWLRGHTLPDEWLDSLPKLGLMVWHRNTPVGVVFLRTVEGGKGLIDGFLTDSDVEYSVRTECLDQLIRDVIKLAHHNDMSGILGLSVNKRVIQRAKRLGFEVMDHKLVTIKCSPWNNIGAVQ